MITVLLWVVVCYALAAAAVHTASRLYWKREPKVKHFVLIAGNHQMQMEWYMRSLRWYSHRLGKEVRVTVVNDGSEDETIDIARCFARWGMDVRFAGEMPGEDMAARARVGAERRMEGSASSGYAEGRRTKQQQQADDREYGRGKKRTSSGEISDETGNFVEKSAPRRRRFRLLMRLRGAYRTARNISRSGNHPDGRGREADAPTHLFWMTKQGVVTDKEHAVLVDLRDPGDLSKLPL